MIAQKCDSANTFELGLCSEYDKTIFGEDVPQNISGNFFFYTNGDSPYAIEEETDNTVDEAVTDMEDAEGEGEGVGAEGGSNAAGDESSGGMGDELSGMYGAMPGGMPGMDAMPNVISIPGMDGGKLSIKMPNGGNPFDNVLRRLGLH